jgi:acetyl-CoA/propionyl-CoA carboxylase biotin carboxyl carrier protein
MTLRKVLIANRGEAAVRVIRACRDAGLASVAVYTAADPDTMHVRLADEAFALAGSTPSAGYLDPGQLLECCRRSGADAVHPGWGFLAENGDFAQAVMDEGLTWIGPPPNVIRELGDKAAARRIAERTGAPLAPGTGGPVTSADEIAAFARRYGLPVAVKAVFGGGGRGLKVARTLEEIGGCYAAAVREATAAFGRGECFAERYLDRPRHVETQCLADGSGRVMVVSTRDCSLQRRHQKLVEEAPAPFLSAGQHDALCGASRAILSAAGYVGAGTCEFLVSQDGAISFLEVNTRLQVEHPVSEEVTGIDLVREMFRIADGQRLDESDPRPRGHAIEFRINGEDPGRGFLPCPGTITAWRPPAGPGIRLDSGVASGDVLGTGFDSLLAKLIVSGRDRQQALERARRALGEFEVDGIATVLPFHQAVVADPAFTAPDGAFAVHTQWVETEFANEIPPFTEAAGLAREAVRESVTVEIDRRRVEILLPAGFGAAGAPGRPSQRTNSPRRRLQPQSRAAGAAGPDVVSPMQGTVVKLAVAEGERVAEGDTLLILEAMKLEQPVTAHRAGMVRHLVAIGSAVPAGAVLCSLEDLR